MEYKVGDSTFEIVVVPASQPILAEFSDVVVRRRKGVSVALELPDSPGEPLWMKFVPERTVNDDIRISFYERRIRRAKKKAAKFAAAVAFNNY
ncbi:MAG TPA: hypothetical protein VMT23_04125 [Candidatus Binatia bacterium]|nr:hypothetical protein [Candidatus Binatia bacterium]